MVKKIHCASATVNGNCVLKIRLIKPGVSAVYVMRIGPTCPRGGHVTFRRFFWFDAWNEEAHT